jgi:hypothetical protein
MFGKKGQPMDDETLLFLLKGGHLSMPDRIARGAWPHAPLSFEAVADYLATVLEQNERWLPCRRQPHQVGQAVREGGTIERQANHRYVYRSNAAHPTSPTILNRSVETVFQTAREAAVYYLHWDLHLPGDLDGWQVVGEKF